jgi:hypothetical protein
MVNGSVTLAVVLLILWMALKSFGSSWRWSSLFIGLSITAAMGLLMVGALNLISVAFAVLFVGGRRFRHSVQRPLSPGALQGESAHRPGAGGRAGRGTADVGRHRGRRLPLVLDRLSRGVEPADRRRRMLVATSPASVLPALLHAPPARRAGHARHYRAGSVDDFLERHRIPIIVATLGVAIAGRRCSISSASISTR